MTSARIHVVLITVMAIAAILTVAPAAAQDDGLQLGSFIVGYGGRTYDSGADQTTFTYVVSGISQPPDLSHFDLGLPVCDPTLDVVAYSPAGGVAFGTDPTTGVNGIKWDSPLLVTDSRTYTITLAGNVIEGSVPVAVKDGNGFEAGMITGPACTTASIDVEKFISTDEGMTWQDADAAPGPNVDLTGQVRFRIVVTNNGNVDLANISLNDSSYDLGACPIPETLAPDAFFECAIGPFAAEEGQHTNVATVTASVDEATVSDTDQANYFGGDRPLIDLEKFVAVNGSTLWQDADTAPGPQAVIGKDVSFKFVVTNDGNVSLADITLTDSEFDLSTCTIPEELEPQEGFECVVGPFPAVEGQHANTATATAMAGDVSVMDTDAAHYLGGEQDLPVVIVIEGPVDIIIGNVIVIFGMEIELDPDDPLLVALKVGDIVRVDGGVSDGSGNVVIIANVVVIVNIDIYVNNTIVVGAPPQVWRDDGECSNPPPPWAPAHGWRAKCERGEHPGGKGPWNPGDR